MRRDYDQFRAAGAEILAIGPDATDAFRQYWAEHQIPFPGIPDPTHAIANRFGQEVKVLRLGRMPALVVVDRDGIVRVAYYGRSMRDIPDNETLLALLDELRSHPRAALRADDSGAAPVESKGDGSEA